MRDALTNEKLPYVTVTFEGLKIGTRTDINGNFFMESEKSPRKIRCSYVGYETLILEITPKTHNELAVLLAESSSKLSEITIRPKKYSKKDNPAVDLIAEVFKHKDQNRKEGLDFYRFDKYEKLQLDLNGITEKFRRRLYFRPFRFIFDNVDTNKITQKVALPFYLRERFLTLSYRKDPHGQKAILRGERQTGFADEGSDLELDEEGASAFANSLFPDVDIYEPKIMLLNTQFVGPLSAIANSMYRFYIVDTVELDGVKLADVFFAPKNDADLAFMGNILVALDSTFAVMKVEMGVSKSINLNWVTDLRVEQEFARIVSTSLNDRTADSNQPITNPPPLMLVKDNFIIDFSILKKSKGQSLLTRKTSKYLNFSINQPLPDTLFSNPTLLVNDSGKVRRRPAIWWSEHRTDSLTRSEKGIAGMIDSIKNVPFFKIMKGIGVLLGSGYQRIGGVDIGPIGTVYSFNDIEGTRIRLGARTNKKFLKPLVLEGYAAFGFRDLRWKYNTAATWSFTKNRPNRFPANQISVSYQKDLRIPGLSLDYLSQDNFSTSFQRAPNDRFLFNESLRFEHKREFGNQLSYTLVAQRKVHSVAGNLLFEYSSGLPDDRRFKSSMVMTEAGIQIRYAPNQQFYQGPSYRHPIASKYPVFSASLRNGFKNVAGGEFSYQKLTVSAEKTFFIAPLGKSDWLLTAGRTFGTVPFPLLEIHPANQTFIFDAFSYNLMNFMEFVSDKYLALNVQHNFQGFFFNKIPGLRKLQWREVGTFKMLFGGLDAANRAENTPGLFYFPKDLAGNSITHVLGSKPYIEASVGIGNLFRIARVDYVWRPNYRELPGVAKWGVRVTFQ